MMVKLHKLQEEFTEMEVEGGLDHGKLWKAWRIYHQAV
jgi:hypothetical protein